MDHVKNGGMGKANFSGSGTKKTGEQHTKSGMKGMPCDASKGGCDKHGGGISYKGTAGGSGGGKQTAASSRRTK
jgi:hypothetical protein